jgi:hypothetical protein
LAEPAELECGAREEGGPPLARLEFFSFSCPVAPEELEAPPALDIRFLSPSNFSMTTLAEPSEDERDLAAAFGVGCPGPGPVAEPAEVEGGLAAASRALAAITVSM